MSYDIGYRRPPSASRFTQGKSGNPKGRPKGSRNMLTLLDEELAKQITVNENGKKRKVTRAHAIVMRLATASLNGDLKTAMALLEFMRRNGQLQAGEEKSLLPDNYQELLQSFLRSQGGSGT